MGKADCVVRVRENGVKRDEVVVSELYWNPLNYTKICDKYTSKYTSTVAVRQFSEWNGQTVVNIDDFVFAESLAQQAKKFLKNSWKNSGSLSKMAPSNSWRRESGSIAAGCKKNLRDCRLL